MSNTITDRDGNVCRVGDTLSNSVHGGPMLKIVGIDATAVVVEWIGRTASGRVPSQVTITRSDFTDRTLWRLCQVGIAKGVR